MDLVPAEGHAAVRPRPHRQLQRLMDSGPQQMRGHMTTKSFRHDRSLPLALCALLALAAPLLLTACSKHGEPATEDGKPTSPATPAVITGATCAAHGAPKELCFICDASLRDKDRLWCNEHDRYEDRCSSIWL